MGVEAGAGRGGCARQAGGGCGGGGGGEGGVDGDVDVDDIGVL